MIIGYKVGTSPVDNTEFIAKIVDGVVSFIPTDPANTDYQQYLAWVEEGNVAEEWTGEP